MASVLPLLPSAIDIGTGESKLMRRGVEMNAGGSKTEQESAYFESPASSEHNQKRFLTIIANGNRLLGLQVRLARFPPGIESQRLWNGRTMLNFGSMTRLRVRRSVYTCRRRLFGIWCSQVCQTRRRVFELILTRDTGRRCMRCEGSKEVLDRNRGYGRGWNGSVRH
jgi:hypothetical protein